MSKKSKAVEVVAKHQRGPAMGQPVYNAVTKEKIGVIDGVIKTKAGKEYRLDNGTVLQSMEGYIFGKSAIVKAVIG